MCSAEDSPRKKKAKDKKYSKMNEMREPSADVSDMSQMTLNALRQRYCPPASVADVLAGLPHLFE